MFNGNSNGFVKQASVLLRISAFQRGEIMKGAILRLEFFVRVRLSHPSNAYAKLNSEMDVNSYEHTSMFENW
jgi:hypothetical protein